MAGLLGGALFVTTVVTGSIGIKTPVVVTFKKIGRDITALLVAISFLMYIL